MPIILFICSRDHLIFRGGRRGRKGEVNKVWYYKDLHGKEGKAQVHESWRGYTRRSKTNPNFQHVSKPYRISQQGVSQSCLINTVYHISIGHLRIPKALRFKMRLVHNLSCENEFYLPENEKRFPYQRLSTYPRFETEERGNSEMAQTGEGLF